MHYLTVDDDLRLQQSRCRALIGGYSDLRPLSDDEHALMQYCWDLLNIVGAMEFITANADELESALECRSFSGLFLKNRQALAEFASSG